MRAVGELTLHELVTTDTTRSLGIPARCACPAPGSWANEPCGCGVAPVTTRLGSTDGRTRLALAYLGENVQIELTFDAGGRIVGDTLAAPQHLVTRNFVKPRARRALTVSSHAAVTRSEAGHTGSAATQGLYHPGVGG